MQLRLTDTAATSAGTRASSCQPVGLVGGSAALAIGTGAAILAGPRVGAHHVGTGVYKHTSPSQRAKC